VPGLLVVVVVPVLLVVPVVPLVPFAGVVPEGEDVVLLPPVTEDGLGEIVLGDPVTVDGVLLLVPVPGKQLLDVVVVPTVPVEVVVPVDDVVLGDAVVPLVPVLLPVAGVHG
jgi:hypothetical protein